MVYTPVIR